MSQSIVAAYQNKYEDENEEQEDSEIKLVFVKRKKFKLCNLILDNCSISETGSLDKVADICSKVTECDLSHNLISDWNEVFRLLDVGALIKFLNLSSNKLGKCEKLPEKPYTSLQCLILCGNVNDWDNLLSLLPSFPSLSHLNIGYSNISALPCLTDNVFPNLTELNLIENNISRFEDVLGLAHTFPNLHTLVLSDNPLSSFGEDQQAIEKFEKLAKLHVNNITINSWEEVSKLRWFPALTDVRMIHWDLFGDMNESERRKMLGALLPNTHLINGAPIPNRESAERWYMRRCQAADDLENRRDKMYYVDEIRYKELYEKYGELPELGDIKFGGQDETITLKLCVPERGVEVEKTFSIYDSLKDIKTFVKNEYSIKNKVMIEAQIVEDAHADLYGLSFDYTLLHRTALKEGDAITVRSDDRHLSTNEILRRYQTQHNLCFKAVITSLESDLNEPLSLNIIHLHKAHDETIYSEKNKPAMTSSNNCVTSSHSFNIPNETSAPGGVVQIKQHWQMLYQVVRGVTPLVRAEDGDSLVLKVATKFEVKLEEGLKAQKRKI